jgi:beta-glucosidase-like glycosyl hydrolase
VAARAVALMKGLQHQGILLRENIFLHGDTETDSHKALPTDQFSKERLEVMEFYLTSKCLKRASSVMVAHLNVPSDLGPNYPSSISYNVVTTILKGVRLL